LRPPEAVRASIPARPRGPAVGIAGAPSWWTPPAPAALKRR